VSAFAAALATLHADPNIGTDAEWQAAAGGAWRPLRVVLRQRQDVIATLGSARAVALEASVLAADMGLDTPRRGDRLRRLSPTTTWRVETAEPDALGLSWTLGLAVAP
jgi:hypothetical protein